MVKILDTDTCIEILTGNVSVIDHRDATEDPVATTWITAAELFYVAARSMAPEHNRDLAVEFLRTLTVLGFETKSVQLFGDFKAALRGAGSPIADTDLMIGSIAVHCRAPTSPETTVISKEYRE